MKLSKIKIESLFNRFSYSIDFAYYSDNVCMFTGPNGFGKTTVIKIIENIAKGNLLFFYTFPFDSIELFFDNEERILVFAEKTTKDESSDVSLLPNNLVFSYYRKTDEEICNCSLRIDDIYKMIPKRNIRFSDFSSFETWTFKTVQDLLSFDFNLNELLENTAEYGQLVFLMQRLKTYFIPAQRVYAIDAEGEFGESVYSRRYRQSKISSIKKVISELQMTLHDAQVSYLKTAQSHDNAFINRLLDDTKRVYSKEEYENKAKELQKRLNEIVTFNMLEKSKVLDYNEKHANIISAYIDDYKEKIDTYNKIVDKLRLFSEILDEKEFINKKIVFSPTAGLSIMSTDGHALDIDFLSSGEQNEIIMLYHFIFGVEDNTVLLIDEPEISLHVAWQLDFLNDIKKISEVKQLQVVIATHSPQIINENWDACFDFYGYAKNR